MSDHPAIDRARGLAADQLKAIAQLEQRVVAHDGGRLKLAWGVLRERSAGEVNDLLAWDAGTLVGFCGIYDFGFGSPELAGAVDPPHRRRGLGSALLADALGLLALRGRATALLVTPAATAAGRGFAGAKGATFDHAEHHLELPGPPAGPPAARASTEGLRVRRAVDADRDAVVEILEAAFGEGAVAAGTTGPTDLGLVVEIAGEVVGALRLDLDGDVGSVYGLGVRTDLRGRGIGRAALYEVCLEARRRGASKVTLEVEVDNDHALGLYTSVGFERRTTEEYFRIAVPAATEHPLP